MRSHITKHGGDGSTITAVGGEVLNFVTFVPFCSKSSLRKHPMLTRELLLLTTKRRFKDETFPENFDPPELAGQTFRCWSMSAAESAKNQAGLIDLETGKPVPEKILEIKARKFIATVGDEEGLLLFKDEDIEAVMALDSGLVDRVCEIADKLNSLPKPEDIAKN